MSNFRNGFKLFFSIILIIFFAAVITSISFYIFSAPKVVRITPNKGDIIICGELPITIEFDRPVERQQIEHSIFPEAYGEWKFEDPMIGDHFFRTITFIPAVNLKPDSNYQIKLTNIKSFLWFGQTGSFSYSFKTMPDTQNEIISFYNSIKNYKFTKEYKHVLTKDVVEKKPYIPSQVTLINIPFHWQNSPLSCEAASLKMALSAKGVNVSEKDIMNKIGYDSTVHNGNVWGNPYNAFVGDINGSMCSTGYGVYWTAVAKAANSWRPAEYFSNWTLKKLISEIKSGNPVIFWGVVPTGKLINCSWYTTDGQYIKAYKETHVRVIVGFVGDSNNPSKIIIKDPLCGDLYWNTSSFLTNWKIYDNSGVLIE